MNKTERSWMDDVLEGNEPGLDTVPLDLGTLADVDMSTRLSIRNEHNPLGEAVDGLLDHASIFAQGELEEFVNEAVQNECGDLRQIEARAQLVASSWDEYAESVRGGRIPEDGRRATLAEAETNSAAALAEASPRFAEGRRLLAEAVAQIHNESRAELSVTTWERLVELDKDGYLSENLGFSASEALATAQQREGVAPSAQASLGDSAAGVDFSREVDEVHEHSLEVVQMEQDMQSGAIASMDAAADAAVARERELELAAQPKPLDPELAEGATVFNSAWHKANKRRLEDAQADEAVSDEVGIELG